MAEFWVPRALQPRIALHRGMARASRGTACAARPRNPVAIRRPSPQRDAGVALGARRSLVGNSLVALAYLGLAVSQLSTVSGVVCVLLAAGYVLQAFPHAIGKE